MIELDPPPWRACLLCDHGSLVDGQQVCRCRAVVAPGAYQPVELMRRRHGACGPEATHLSFPGLQG